MKPRASGILTHITSLPSSFGIGDLGPKTHKFVDFLSQCGQSYWQILPLNPTDSAYDDSPYHSVSAMAANPLLISPEWMVRDGLLEEKDLKPVPEFSESRVDFSLVTQYKDRLFETAFQRFQKQSPQDDFFAFCERNSEWLHDFALFKVLKDEFSQKKWSEWPAEHRDRNDRALKRFSREHEDKIKKEKFLQYLFMHQWNELKEKCRKRDVHIIGDIPIYVDYDSADVWSHPGFFKLNSQKQMESVSGVPPDYFSETGQLWGNPLYDWDAIQKSDFKWWVSRLDRVLEMCDIVRIDHFRGWVAFWEVPVSEKTAVNGRWVKAPVKDFFEKLSKRYLHLPFIAEDLGIITPDVREVMRCFNLPGMKVLLFAFGSDDPYHPYLPHNYEENYVVYTGTHDNNTVKGWFEKEAGEDEKSRLSRYLGKEVRAEEVHWDLIRLAMSSVARTVIFPIQDILGLGQEARMNRPATNQGNWKWRMTPVQLSEARKTPLKDLTRLYARL
ncbi:MAG: 4-alpha-glucanotransferase [Acidobacteriota bacterium]